MKNRLYYCSSDLGDILIKMIEFEEKIEYWNSKAKKRVEVVTNLYFDLEEGDWKGELEVIDGEEIK